MSELLECWNCGRGVDDQPLPLVRSSTCPACDADLHVCRMCEYFAPSVAKSCREPVAEEVRDKTRANFCDYFRAVPGAHAGDGKAREAENQLNSLFGLGAQAVPDTRSPDPLALERKKREQAEQADDELRRLFGLDDKEG